MERLRQKVAALHTRAEEYTEQWQQHHARLLALLGNAQAILGRLPVLANRGNYGVLTEVEGYAERLQAQQVGALEGLLSKCQDAMTSLRACVQGLARCARDAQRQVASQRPQLTPQQLAGHSGCEASLQSCIDGLHQVGHMFADEYRLIEAAIPRFCYGVAPGELAATAALLADQPSVQCATISDILEKGRLTSTGERRS